MSTAVASWEGSDGGELKDICNVVVPLATFLAEVDFGSGDEKLELNDLAGAVDHINVRENIQQKAMVEEGSTSNHGLRDSICQQARLAAMFCHKQIIGPYADDVNRHRQHYAMGINNVTHGLAIDHFGSSETYLFADDEAGKLASALHNNRYKATFIDPVMSLKAVADASKSICKRRTEIDDAVSVGAERRKLFEHLTNNFFRKSMAECVCCAIRVLAAADNLVGENGHKIFQTPISHDEADDDATRTKLFVYTVCWDPNAKVNVKSYTETGPVGGCNLDGELKNILSFIADRSTYSRFKAADLANHATAAGITYGHEKKYVCITANYLVAIQSSDACDIRKYSDQNNSTRNIYVKFLPTAGSLKASLQNMKRSNNRWMIDPKTFVPDCAATIDTQTRGKGGVDFSIVESRCSSITGTLVGCVPSSAQLDQLLPVLMKDIKGSINNCLKNQLFHENVKACEGTLFKILKDLTPDSLAIMADDESTIIRDAIVLALADADIEFKEFRDEDESASEIQKKKYLWFWHMIISKNIPKLLADCVAPGGMGDCDIAGIKRMFNSSSGRENTGGGGGMKRRKQVVDQYEDTDYQESRYKSKKENPCETCDDNEEQQLWESAILTTHVFELLEIYIGLYIFSRKATITKLENGITRKGCTMPTGLYRVLMKYLHKLREIHPGAPLNKDGLLARLAMVDMKVFGTFACVLSQQKNNPAVEEMANLITGLRLTALAMPFDKNLTAAKKFITGLHKFQKDAVSPFKALTKRVGQEILSKGYSKPGEEDDTQMKAMVEREGLNLFGLRDVQQ